MDGPLRYLVVVCPRCQRAQAIEARFQSPACRRCRAPLETARLRSFYRGDEEAEARAAVQRVSAQLAGMGIEDYARLLESIDRERVGTIDGLLGDLERRGEFDAAAFADAARSARVPGDPAKLLARLLAENRLYEPRAGRYRTL